MNEDLDDPPPIMAVDPKTKNQVPHEVPHGTATAYRRHGCRCSLCKAAQRVAMREWRHAKGQGTGKARPEAQHGTRSKYVGSKNVPGCRCDDCKAANSEYQRVWQKLNRMGLSLRAEWED